jgi:putative membrane protein insertion efficiency factor
MFESELADEPVPNTRKALSRMLATLLLLGILDCCRDPPTQITGWVYVRIVRMVYQPVARPLLAGRVRCRYHPSCSDYSIEAVSQYGIVRGLILTFNRISSCKTNIPLGTLDPVPEFQQKDPADLLGLNFRSPHHQ